jgi:ankyrin repeat protein
MVFVHSKNELDNALFNETSKINPDENVIRQLIQNGANINAIDCIDHTVIGNLISSMNNEDTNIKYLKLLIELGADVNLRINGVNCLFDALFTYRKDIFEILLEAGANPNCIIDDEGFSILDMIINDEWFWEIENDLELAAKQKEIGNLLIRYGAKQSKELYTEELDKYIY